MTLKPMSPEEFRDRMQQINDAIYDDGSSQHIDADELLMECLRLLGYGEGVEIFDKMYKWYE